MDVTEILAGILSEVRNGFQLPTSQEVAFCEALKYKTPGTAFIIPNGARGPSFFQAINEGSVGDWVISIGDDVSAVWYQYRIGPGVKFDRMNIGSGKVRALCLDPTNANVGRLAIMADWVDPKDLAYVNPQYGQQG